MSRARPVVLATFAAVTVACSGGGSQVTTSNENVPAGGFGSFADTDTDATSDDDGRSGRSARSY